MMKKLCFVKHNEFQILNLSWLLQATVKSLKKMGPGLSLGCHKRTTINPYVMNK